MRSWLGKNGKNDCRFPNSIDYKTMYNSNPWHYFGYIESDLTHASYVHATKIQYNAILIKSVTDLVTYLWFRYVATNCQTV